MFLHAVEIVAAGHHGQDRAIVREHGDALLIALADGAGGTGRGALAAQAIVDAARADVDAAALIARLDDELVALGGQATAVVVYVDAAGLRGASVGDSEAWIVDGDDIIDVTAAQHRKPLVGDGCVPVAFEHGGLGGGTLVVASDGLFRYIRRDELVRVLRGAELPAVARALVDLVRLPGGGLQDDVAIVVCRERR